MMSLNIMIAGCAKEERDDVGSSVKKAFVDRPTEEKWNVSLVKIANQWSVEIDGPDPQYKGLSLVTPPEDLTGALRRALKSAGAGAGGNGSSAASSNGDGASAAPGPEGERKDRHSCEGCSAAFEVVYQAARGEAEEMCPVACPQCWHVNHVPIAAGAGTNGDYRAQAVAG
jgi:hypothetical protein